MSRQEREEHINHLAIILDGNRRYAKRLALQPWKGHEAGAKQVEKLLDWCKELKIKQLTVYCLSTENLKRDKKELDFLLKLLDKKFSEFENDERIYKNRVKIRFVGNLSLLPENIQRLCKRIQEKTKNHYNYILNFCLAYGGREELTNAVRKIAGKVKEGQLKIKDIDENMIKQNLYLPDEPDLIIRTGGRARTSNFLPFQSVYSELIFLDKLWPEFTKEDLQACVKEYKKRKRNFGR